MTSLRLIVGTQLKLCSLQIAGLGGQVHDITKALT